MYTEYVFENKKYEVALRDMKSALFDIVSAEEAKIASLREKAFTESQIGDQAAMQALFVKQDDCLRDILSISKKLTKAIQNVDSCSRELKQLESKGMADMIANMQQQNVAKEENYQTQEINPQEVVEEKIAPTSMEDIANSIVHDEGDALSNPDMQGIVPEYTQTSGIQTMTDDIMEAAKTQDIPLEAPETGPVVEEVVQEDKNLDFESNVIQNPVIVPNDEPVITAVTDEYEVDQNQENAPMDAAIVPEDKPMDEVVVTEDNPTDVVIVPDGGSADAPLEGEEKPHLIMAYNDSISTVKDETQEQAKTEEGVASDVTLERISFKKRSTTAPKVIMVGGKQALKLKQSLATQEALLNAKGIIPRADEVTKQQQIESMMTEANALYADGKVEEAQNMFDQISELNKELQGESVGMAK